MTMRPQKPEDGVAWVTGASSGIGRALALRLARSGWRVAATARNQVALDELALEAGGNLHAYAGDVTHVAGMEAIVSRIEAELGPIALAVLNAGVYAPVDARRKSDDAVIRNTLSVNLDGMVNSLIPVMNAMVARRNGQIAVVSSVAGYGPLPTSSAYGGSKAAVTHMSAALRFDLERADVLMQVISPGFVRTPLTDKNDFPMPFLVELEDAVDRIISGLSTKRFEIVFPRRFGLMLKTLNLLPWWIYLPLVKRLAKIK